MDDVLKICIVLVGIIFAGALATWDPESIVGGSGSTILVKSESPGSPPGALDIRVDVEKVDWGVIVPGGSSLRSVLIMNYGSLSGILSVAAEKFVPVEAEMFLRLSWNLDGYVLESGKNVAAVLRLDVSPDIKEITDFSFNIVVNAVALK